MRNVIIYGINWTNCLIIYGINWTNCKNIRKSALKRVTH
ncbi:hypothetical protein LTSEMON_4023 [Salmonella enterica subsp. enterica serovar Montevideo str. S5-403]|uniref:Uncharacterized protein n=1 Tax=Salmonella enterica subsp. enterica serovar Montevideo str. S5-403 TaxID=913242 RepID=G5Q6X0_SALMO|nr:hypothetical protein LTSEMON_4023 [Salmonella enterica subsp. enterica serovar Montevideo str. S5-403]